MKDELIALYYCQNVVKKVQHKRLKGILTAQISNN